MNAIYDDLSQISEMISLETPSLILEGCAFYFNAFEVVSSLQPAYLQAVSRAANSHAMFDRTPLNEKKIVVDTFHIEEAKYGMFGDVGSGDSSHSEDEKGIMAHMQQESEPLHPVRAAAEAAAMEKREKKKKGKGKKAGKGEAANDSGDQTVEDKDAL